MGRTSCSRGGSAPLRGGGETLARTQAALPRQGRVSLPQLVVKQTWGISERAVVGVQIGTEILCGLGAIAVDLGRWFGVDRQAFLFLTGGGLAAEGGRARMRRSGAAPSDVGHASPRRQSVVGG